MKIVIAISLLHIANLCTAQERDDMELPPPPPARAEKEPLVLAANQEEAKPKFDLPAYLNSNLKYPAVAMEEEIEGRIVVEFIVEKDGSVANVRVIKGRELGGGLPEEAVRVVKNMPAWKPATQNGQLVRSYMTLPVNFRLEDKSRLNSKYQFPVDKDVTLIQGAFPSFDYKDYIEQNKVYPSKAIEKEIQGLVAIQFIVETDSSISNVTIVKGKDLGYGLPEEALRLIKNMPPWKPALDIDKKQVRSYVIFPVYFKRNDP